MQGRRVAITRTHEDSETLARRLRDLGVEVLVVPAIQRAPPRDPALLDEAVARLLRGEYEGALFTSPTSVRVLRERLGERLLSLQVLGAVGPATEAALLDWGQGPIVLAPRHDGASLAEALIAQLGERLSGMRLLQPRAEEGREELSRGLLSRGARVEVLPAYRTLPRGPKALAPLCTALAKGALDAVIFASPSAVRAVRDACGAAFLGRAIGVAIGQTTASALREAGARRVEAAEEATDEGLLSALRRSLYRR